MDSSTPQQSIHEQLATRDTPYRYVWNISEFGHQNSLVCRQPLFQVGHPMKL
jgi:hypothetical protein